MANVEHEPITGVWGRSPQRGPGADPLKLKAFWSLAPFQKCLFILTENSMLCYGPLVSELGDPECMVPPTNPVIGGCAPPAPGSAAYAPAALRDFNSLTASSNMSKCHVS